MMGIGSEAFNCIACEDRPYAPNDPCAVCGKTSTVALPDELEVVAWRYRPAHVPATAPWAYMDDREPSASFTAEALACASEAHSTIAALRAKLREVVEEREAWLEASIRQQKRAETAEAEVKRLTENNEALGKALEPFVALAKAIDADDPEMPDRHTVAARAIDLRGNAVRVTLGHLRTARAALNSREKAE